jgi:hypothetical protein
MAIPFTKVRTKLGLDDTFGFGRHKGYTVLEIIKDRPEYISWLIANTDLKFYESVYDELLRHIAPAPHRSKPKSRRNNGYLYNRYPDYDTDYLGDWFDDAPF